jgi:hypothetical protein
MEDKEEEEAEAEAEEKMNECDICFIMVRGIFLSFKDFYPLNDSHTVNFEQYFCQLSLEASSHGGLS